MSTQILMRPARAVNPGKDFFKIFLAMGLLAMLVAVSLFAAGLLLSGQIEFSKIISLTQKFYASENPVAEEVHTSSEMESKVMPIAAVPALETKLAQLITESNSQIADADKYAVLISAASNKHSLDPFLLSALLYQESKFNNLSMESNKLGLFMISASEAQVLAAELKLPFMRAALYNPDYNIKLGSYKFSRLLEITKGNIEKALVAFKAGEFTAEGFTVGEVDPSLLQYKDNVLAMAEKFSA